MPFRLRLDRLHEVLQEAFGWTNSHLYESASETSGLACLTAALMTPSMPARKRFLPQSEIFRENLPCKAGFGDPFLLEAIRRCPPEDVGGPWGYQEFRQAIADTNHERHHELVEWWGRSDYDPAEVDARNLGKNVEALVVKWKH